MTIHRKLSILEHAINQALKRLLPKYHCQYESLLDAIRHSTLNGGKRIRPILTMLVADMLNASEHAAIIPACAVECMHASSLIHDDLPAMDNADLRRGKPACHKAFNEAVAILAGDSLQIFAFELLADKDNAPLSHDQRLKMSMQLARASGMHGMMAGQMIDIETHVKNLTLDQLQEMHQLKTGALIKTSLLLGAHTAHDTSHEHLTRLAHVGNQLGLLFQITDDILDATGDSMLTGKPTGQDAENNKTTFVTLLGLHEAKQYAKTLTSNIIESLQTFGPRARDLIELTEYIRDRDR